MNRGRRGSDRVGGRRAERAGSRHDRRTREDERRVRLSRFSGVGQRVLLDLLVLLGVVLRDDDDDDAGEHDEASDDADGDAHPLVVDHRDLVRVLRGSNLGALAALGPEVDHGGPQDQQALMGEKLTLFQLWQ